MTNASKNHDWIVIGSLYIVSLLMLSTTYFAVGRYIEQGVTARVVYNVCQLTRLTEANETACIVAQEQSNTEYLCKDNNRLDTNKCWIEQK
jgi:hypothetical protein